MTFKLTRRLPPVIARPRSPGVAALMAPTPVLVVDDEEPVRRLAARMLSLAGFAPVTAEDGPDAITRWTALDPCPLLVTDLMMPIMDGTELARILRRQDPDLKVLYMTGFSDRLFAERKALSDGEAYLDKPFTVNGLIEAVSLLLTGRLKAYTAPRAVGAVHA